MAANPCDLTMNNNFGVARGFWRAFLLGVLALGDPHGVSRD